MQKLTKSEAIANHRKMWRWIAEQTLKLKRKVEKWEYFERFNFPPEEIPMLECYCCKYANSLYGCESCPIEWGGHLRNCMNREVKGDRQGLYALWRDTTDYERAAELAAQIAELPERKDV